MRSHLPFQHYKFSRTLQTNFIKLFLHQNLNAEQMGALDSAWGNRGHVLLCSHEHPSTSAAHHKANSRSHKHREHHTRAPGTLRGRHDTCSVIYNRYQFGILWACHYFNSSAKFQQQPVLQTLPARTSNLPSDSLNSAARDFHVIGITGLEITRQKSLLQWSLQWLGTLHSQPGMQHLNIFHLA